MKINIRRYIDTGYRVAFVTGGFRTLMGWGNRKYNITDASLAQIERLAIQKTTQRYTMVGHSIVENDYIMRMR